MEMNRSKGGAIIERKIANTRDLLRNSNSSKIRTTIERIVANACDGIRNNRVMASCDKGVSCCFYNSIAIITTVIYRVFAINNDGGNRMAF